VINLFLTKTLEGGAKMWSKPEALAEGFDVILATPERVLVSQHRPDTEGLISILKCLKAKSYVLSFNTWEGLGELPRPSALRTRLMHFPFEIIIWDTKVF
jgi:hypothetical protein